VVIILMMERNVKKIKDTCNDPKGCPKICPGLSTNTGPFENATHIDGDNIGLFDKSCTIIDGSLLFNAFSFINDSHCTRSAIRKEQLSVFENVREITGSLAIESWGKNLEDFCVFRNLEKIGGRHLSHDEYALIIALKSTEANVKTLCFDSLKELTNGNVYLQCNAYIDFLHSVDWTTLWTNNSKQSLKISKQECKKSLSPCNEQCDNGCWGWKAFQCRNCKKFTDYTDENGLRTNLPKIVGGFKIPGIDNTTCVETCNFTKGVYADETKKDEKRCLPCHEQCYKTCIGPTASNCTDLLSKRCKHFLIDSNRCVPKCPTNYFKKVKGPKEDSLCIACSKSCLSFSTTDSSICNGKADEFSEIGCRHCHHRFDAATSANIYTGSACKICHDLHTNCPYGCIIYKDSKHKCIDKNKTVIIATVVSLFIAIIGIVIIIYCYFSRRSRRTIQKIQDIFPGANSANPDADAIELPTFTSPGSKPNFAQLRIVTEAEIQIGRMLGSGAFGEVWKGVWTPCSIQGEKIQIPVAVKTLKTSEEMLHDANNQVMEEAYIMASVDCIYLTRLLGICMKNQVSLITQLMPLGSLLEYIRDTRYKSKISSRQMLTWCLQISRGMKYLEEEKHLVHRDLAARNVLIKTPNHVKITDFGLARMLDVKEDIYYAEGGKLPIKWLAIECITERTFSHLSDVWAFGVTCWEIFTFGSRPYDGVKAADMLLVLERGDRLQQPTCATIDIYMLMIKCWMVDRLCRPTFAELVKEFEKMVQDPSRYLVLKTDDLISSSPIPMSPTMDETEFFRELLKDEQIAGCSGVIADEPDQYLLCSNIQNESVSTYTEVSRTASLTQQPQYSNVEAIDHQLYYNGSQFTENKATKNDVPFNQGRSDRLFSRNTRSAHLPSSSSAKISEPCDLASSNHNVDDVFTSGHTTISNKQLVNQNDDDSYRKNSDDSQRYTDDPTYRPASMIDSLQPFSTNDQSNRGDLLSDETFNYDESNYLLPDTMEKKRTKPPGK